MKIFHFFLGSTDWFLVNTSFPYSFTCSFILLRKIRVLSHADGSEPADSVREVATQPELCPAGREKGREPLHRRGPTAASVQRRGGQAQRTQKRQRPQANPGEGPEFRHKPLQHLCHKVSAESDGEEGLREDIAVIWRLSGQTGRERSGGHSQRGTAMRAEDTQSGLDRGAVSVKGPENAQGHWL